MHVPETAVDKHDGVVFRQYYIRVSGVTPVSYTHLDVYKRQTKAWPVFVLVWCELLLRTAKRH